MNNFVDKSQLTQQKLTQLLETGENEQIEFKVSFDNLNIQLNPSVVEGSIING